MHVFALKIRSILPALTEIRSRGNSDYFSLESTPQLSSKSTFNFSI